MDLSLRLPPDGLCPVRYRQYDLASLPESDGGSGGATGSDDQCVDCRAVSQGDSLFFRTDIGCVCLFLWGRLERRVLGVCANHFVGDGLGGLEHPLQRARGGARHQLRFYLVSMPAKGDSLAANRYCLHRRHRRGIEYLYPEAVDGSVGDAFGGGGFR